MMGVVWADAIMMYSSRILSNQTSMHLVSIHAIAWGAYTAPVWYVASSILVIHLVAVPWKMTIVEFIGIDDNLCDTPPLIMVTGKDNYSLGTRFFKITF